MIGGFFFVLLSPLVLLVQIYTLEKIRNHSTMMQTASNQSKSEASCKDIRNLSEAGAEIDEQNDSENMALLLAVKNGRTIVKDCSRMELIQR
ncbi:unnamed protein product [Onchocerca flexuosa]|uniref:ANK_REP_REGION domain-containing protein n=1 Tax=Onchocerca flexuosa TaxID=387005 RepID=A0A183H498_9BILA|nr:unnamed protein product [Onchocerca flexuosa]